MSLLRLITQSLLFHGRMHLAVALGIAAATAVLTGALLVGDSVRGSLKHLALDRVGKIDEVLIADRFFRQELASEVLDDSSVKQHGWQTVPAIVIPSATVETQKTMRRSAGVTLIASPETFWQMGTDAIRPERMPQGNEVVLNAPLAKELGVKAGDTLIIRLAKAAQIPADSALGRKTDRITSLADLKVAAVVPAESLGRFAIHPAQTTPRNIYVPLPLIQEALQVPGQINCILAGRGAFELYGDDEKTSQALHSALKPTLSDYGLSLNEIRIRASDENAPDVTRYYSLTSDRMLLDDATVGAAMKAVAELKPQPVLTYLANDIVKVQSPKSKVQSFGIPYSMITAIDPAAGGPLVDQAGNSLPPLADDEIALNAWAAKDQQVDVGDTVRVTWFEPETTHGQEQETSAEFRVAAIVPLTEPAVPFSRRRPARYDQRPTAANDPDLTPTVAGITDQETIDNWDAPFKYDRTRLRQPQDDQYWRNHRTTPKAFVSLATGQKLWGSRFGRVTSIRIPAEGSGFRVQGSGGERSEVGGQRSEAEIERLLLAELHQHNAELDFAFRPIKREGLAAASGTTPFDVLFLLLSMFIIAAALMLVWLLFRLGIEQRAAEIGLLQSLGWPAGKSSRVLLIEGGIVAALGGLVGTLGGIGYAWLMLAGLRTWWVGAIATPFLQLYITPTSLIVGYLLGVLVSLATIWFSLRSLARVPAKRLLAGEARSDSPLNAKRRSGMLPLLIAAGLLMAAVGLAALAINLGGEAQAGAFLGAGAAFLAAMLLFISRGLARPTTSGVTRSVVGLA
ncbi:MAG TPA: ABC transporter permease, partial [Pirellulaceae bacterium]|nr:ABC transporter permease [Pirellulaceae bacterium]